MGHSGGIGYPRTAVITSTPNIHIFPIRPYMHTPLDILAYILGSENRVG